MRCGFLSSFWLAATIGLCGLGSAAPGAEKNNPADVVPKADETNESQQTLRSYLQLQEQLHDTLLTIERTRKETEAAARANADAITLRLEAIEQSLGTQQIHQANLLQNSNRVTLIAAGLFAVLGLLAMVFTAWFLLRAMNRLAMMASVMPTSRALGQGNHPTIPSPDANLMDLHPVEPSSGRLLGAIDRLEKRMGELEHAARPSLPADQNARQNGSHAHPEHVDHPGADPDRISLILGKGQSLMSLDKTEEAIACFDEAIALDPRHTEALLKKGTALEKLNRLEDALQCYDRAIAANGSLAMAYLYKGGVCNQLERFGEALDCYEQALRCQQKRGA